MRVRENEVVFKFPLTLTRFSNFNDTLFYITHTNHEVSRSLQENKPLPPKHSKNLRDKDKTTFPKSKKSLMK